MHVLIVDDEPLAQVALRNILSGRREVEGYETANDAVEALDKLMHQSFDVLLLDLSMPEVSGIQLLDQLKREPFQRQDHVHDLVAAPIRAVQVQLLDQLLRDRRAALA